MNVDISQLQGFTLVKGANAPSDLFDFYDGELKVIDGYTVKTTPTIHLVNAYQTQDEPFSLKSGTTDTYIAQFENNIGSLQSAYITGIAEQDTPPTPPTPPTPTEIDVDFSGLSGFDIVKGTQFDTTQFTDYDIELKVKENYTVLSVPILEIYRENDDIPETFQLVLKSGSEDVYYYSYNNNYTDVVSVKVVGRAVTDIQSLYTDYPLITCYKVDEKIMQRIADLRFQNTVTDEKEDLGKYILSFVRYPCEIDVLNESKIKIGYFQTDITTDLIEKQINEFSLGKVKIDGLQGDTSDIAQCNIKILLPYFGFYSLDSKYINTEIEVTYKIDVVTNTCIISIFSNGILIDMIETNIGYELPYILKENTQSIDIHNALTSNVLKYNTPCVIVEQKSKVNGFYNETNIEVENLNDIDGFIKTTDYTIENIPSETERQMIINLMQQGLYV